MTENCTGSLKLKDSRVILCLLLSAAALVLCVSMGLVARQEREHGPDLAVMSVEVAAATPSGGVLLQFEIVNHGDIASAQTEIAVTGVEPGLPAVTMQVQELWPGEIAVIELWLLVPNEALDRSLVYGEPWLLEVFVDPRDVIDESQEENNHGIFEVWIPEPGVVPWGLIEPCLPPAPTGPEPSRADPSELVADELMRMAPGKILFNPPEEMTVSVSERIEVRVASELVENLTEGLRGRGEPQIVNIEIGEVMEVQLRGEHFRIEELSPRRQMMTESHVARWDFSVTPLKAGQRFLILTACVMVKLPDRPEVPLEVKVFDKSIEVKVNPMATISQFLGRNWQWFVTTLVGSGLIGWIVRRRRKLSQRKHRAKLPDEEN